MHFWINVLMSTFEYVYVMAIWSLVTGHIIKVYPYFESNHKSLVKGRWDIFGLYPKTNHWPDLSVECPLKLWIIENSRRKYTFSTDIVLIPRRRIKLRSMFKGCNCFSKRKIKPVRWSDKMRDMEPFYKNLVFSYLW